MEDLLKDYTNEEIIEKANEIKPNLKDYYATGDDYGICVGSYKAYNECEENERGYYNALGCNYEGNAYIDPQMISDELEFYAVLYASGFTFEEMDELFVQDTDGSSFGLDCYNTHPYDLIKTLNDYDVFEGNNMIKLKAIISLCSLPFCRAVEELENYELYKEDKIEFEENYCKECWFTELKAIENSWLNNYITIDYERMADDDDIIIGEYEDGDDIYTLIKY